MVRPISRTSCCGSNGLVKAAYEEVTCRVRVGEELSSPFRVMRGLRQGCVLSLILFSLYINSLTEELRSKGWG